MLVLILIEKSRLNPHVKSTLSRSKKSGAFFQEKAKKTHTETDEETQKWEGTKKREGKLGGKKMFEQCSSQFNLGASGKEEVQAPNKSENVWKE